MKTRTTRKTVTFAEPFMLEKSGELLPAGAYLVETDEELIEGLSFPAYRRVRTVMSPASKAGSTVLTRSFTIAPELLDSALQRDMNSRPDTV